jgi:glycosyltransferase involved in cell wall biosynthesis
MWWCHEPRRKIFWKEMGDAKPRDRLSWHLKRPLFKLLTRLFALRCKAVLVHSNYMKNIVTKALRTRMLCVIPFGIQIENYPYAPLVKSRVLLYVGRIAEVKNIYRLIEALALVKYMEVKLIVVGEGAASDNDLMERLIDRLDLQENVTWYRSLGDLIPKYVESEMVIYPCINEPFGIVPLEAMAVGRPVIAANIGGPAETIVDGETGVLVNPYDKREIANAIKRLLDNKDSSKIGLNCRKRVENRYTFDRFFSNVENVLFKAVK